MKIIGHVGSFDGVSEASAQDPLVASITNTKHVFGAQIATREFVRNLFRFGDFDEYHLFVNPFYLSAFPEAVREVVAHLKADKRLRVRGLNELFRKDNPTIQVIHRPEGAGFARLLHLRNALGLRRTPVTTVTYSVSYASEFSQLSASIMAGVQPFDGIVCTGRTAVRVVKHQLRAINRLLFKTYARRLMLPYLGDIGLGVDCDKYRPRGKEQARRMLELPLVGPIVLWIGRLSPFDKAELTPALEAFAKARQAQQGRAAVLVVAGDDTYGFSQTIKKTASRLGVESAVIVRPNPSDAVKPLYYSAADIFFSPVDNIQETYGQTILEAMASGLPVICSDWNGYRVLVKQSETGFLIPTSWTQCDDLLLPFSPWTSYRYDHLFLSQATALDATELRRALLALIGSPSLRERMGRAARESALATHGWGTIIDRFSSLWSELHQRANQLCVTRLSGSWLSINYTSSFKEYPTQMVKPSTLVIKTHPPPNWIDLDGLSEHFPELAWIYDANLAREILRNATMITRVGRLQTICLSRFGASGSVVSWHVLRLAKYGFLLFIQKKAIQARRRRKTTRRRRIHPGQELEPPENTSRSQILHETH